MYRVVTKTADLPREEWLKYRTQGIGGSDVSIIAGINPFRSAHQLWLEKTGQAEPEETESEYAHFGTLLEPVVRKEFTRRTGIKVRQKHMLLQSVEYPFMFAVERRIAARQNVRLNPIFWTVLLHFIAMFSGSSSHCP